MFEVQKEMSVKQKLEILADAAKYDVACTSSGVDRKGEKGALGNASACGICHSFAADGRCISLLKILMTNHCVYDCRYCVNRSSNDVVRTTFTPEEICDLTVEFYKRNYIEGLFLSSGVLRNPAHTMEKICETLLLLRTRYRFRGYIHVKAIPGAPEELLARAGYLADRISINMELPTEEGLKKLAPNKSLPSILPPMAKVRGTIAAHRLAIGRDARMERHGINRQLSGGIFSSAGKLPDDRQADIPTKNLLLPETSESASLRRPFAPAGQSTQMIIGATPETDYQILNVAEALYKKFDLKRVFYSAFIPVNNDLALPDLREKGPPLLREHRLYQADWLLRFYHFEASELLDEAHPNFNVLLDPKCCWALNHLDIFPVEVNQADYYTLLRVPGIGCKSAARIVKARRTGNLRFEDLKKIGVVLKRALYFITCGGRMMYRTRIDQDYITRNLLNTRERLPEGADGMTYRQLSLFDDEGKLCAGGSVK